MHRERWSEKEGCEGERRRLLDDEEPEERRLRGRRERERENRADVPAPFESSGLDPWRIWQEREREREEGGKESFSVYNIISRQTGPSQSGIYTRALCRFMWRGWKQTGKKARQNDGKRRSLDCVWSFRWILFLFGWRQPAKRYEHST